MVITDKTELKAPFPYFGGKSRAADSIWARLGSVANFVEPFAGSLAVLLKRPRPFHGPETVNDADGLLANFWRALAFDPEAVAHHADWPVSECDLHARHIWLVEQRENITTKLEGDPEFYDSKLAGWWVWGLSCWIGSGWCSGSGPWRAVEDENGNRQMTQVGKPGVERTKPHLGDQGQGVNRKRVHLSNQGQGVNRKLVHLGNQGQGVNRKRVDLDKVNGKGVISRRNHLVECFAELAERLRYVRVCCGDWKRVTGPSVTTKHGLTAVLLDPPYADTAGRQDGLYAKDSLSVAHEVREWAIKNGNDPLLRIALCGYEGEHEMPDSWEVMTWEPKGGYDGQSKDKSTIGKNRAKERIWFSPHCIKDSLPLFASLEVAE